MIKNLMLTKKIAIISVVFITVAVSFIIVFLVPLFSEIKEYSEKISGKKENIDMFKNESKLLEIFENKGQILDEDIAKARSCYINKKLPIELIKFLEGLAFSCQLNIEILPVLSDSERAIVFNLSLTGRFQNVLRFVEKIEYSPYLVEIKSISSRRSREADAIDSDIKIKVLTDESQF